MKLNTTLNDLGKDGVYDQFEGKSTTYDFNMYSTTIDESKVTNDIKQRAEQVEYQLANTAASNKHLAEERNQIDLRDDGEYEDEEARYGAVDRRNKTIVYGSQAQAVTPLKFKNFHAKIDKNGM